MLTMLMTNLLSHVVLQMLFSVNLCCHLLHVDYIHSSFDSITTACVLLWNINAMEKLTSNDARSGRKITT